MKLLCQPDERGTGSNNFSKITRTTTRAIACRKMNGFRAKTPEPVYNYAWLTIPIKTYRCTRCSGFFGIVNWYSALVKLFDRVDHNYKVNL